MWQFTKRVFKWLWKVLAFIIKLWWALVTFKLAWGIDQMFKQIDRDNERQAELEEKRRYGGWWW